MKDRALLAGILLALVSCGKGEGYVHEADGGHSVTVGLGFNLCPEFEYSVFSPSEIEPGASAELVVDATDPEGDEVSYRWRSTSGSFSERRMPATAYTCDAPGTQTLTVTAEDSEGCGTRRALVLRCLD